MGTTIPRLRHTKVAGTSPTAEEFNHLQASVENYLRDSLQNTTLVDHTTGVPTTKPGPPIAAGKLVGKITLYPGTASIPKDNTVPHGFGRLARYHIGQMYSANSGQAQFDGTIYNSPNNPIPDQQLVLRITGTVPVTLDLWLF